MSAKRHRLDRFISQHSEFNRKDIRLLLAQKRIFLDHQPAKSASQPIDEFTHVQLEDRVLQDNQPLYIMLYKPAGVVTAVKDDEHKTVLDLIDHPNKDQLHHVGRLDLNTSGLLLLTNDGRFSKKLTHPDHHISKRYHVTLANPIDGSYRKTFQQGIYFAYEGITTRPAELEILNDYQAIITLTEGRYHQIKRMFGHFRNQVIELHRHSIGMLELDSKLEPGQWRFLKEEEFALLEQEPDAVMEC